MFTIGFVNYKTSLYLETQFKIYESFAGEPFKIIVVDNSKNNNETSKLEELKHKVRFPLEIVINHNPKQPNGSGQHGEGLQIIYEMTQTPYLVVQDPDFFWVKPHFLRTFRKKLQDFTVIGAPYHNGECARWNGPADYPAAFGAVYNLLKTGDRRLDFNFTDPLVETSHTGAIKDVGWRIRGLLKNDPYEAFSLTYTDLNIGPHSYENTGTTHTYWCGDEVIGYHLLRGSFEERPPHLSKDWAPPSQLTAPSEWLENRRTASEYFLKEISYRASLGYKIRSRARKLHLFWKGIVQRATTE